MYIPMAMVKGRAADQMAVRAEVLGNLDGKGCVQPHKDAVQQPCARADDADGGGGLGPDVADHGRVDVFHGRYDHLLQDRRDAQRQYHLRRLAQRDVLALPHPGGKLFE